MVTLIKMDYQILIIISGRCSSCKEASVTSACDGAMGQTRIGLRDDGLSCEGQQSTSQSRGAS